jgi:putative transposase
MANTFTQIHLQIVFAVENGISLIRNSWKEDLYKYITGIVQNNDHKLLSINGMPDHIHLLIGMRPIQALSYLMQQVKRESSSWINENKPTKGKFNWQEGYGAFSYSRSHLPDVIKYIENQELHHKKRTFIEEYKELLDKFEIIYDERYIFKQVM